MNYTCNKCGQTFWGGECAAGSYSAGFNADNIKKTGYCSACERKVKTENEKPKDQIIIKISW